MTRKHFKAIANAINENKQVIQVGDMIDDLEEVVNVDGLIYSLCDIFKSLNPRFNKQTFVDACNDNL